MHLALSEAGAGLSTVSRGADRAEASAAHYSYCSVFDLAVFISHSKITHTSLKHHSTLSTSYWSFSASVLMKLMKLERSLLIYKLTHSARAIK